MVAAVMGVAQYIEDNINAWTSATHSSEFVSSNTHNLFHQRVLVHLASIQLLF